MKQAPRSIELLAPAKDLATAIAAVDHGADAVYIGASSFGARASAANDIEDIQRLADYAHQFRAKVYATVNTIVYDDELKAVEKLVKSLYRAQVDAIIVQDMGLLRLDIPPIELHASTQCDTRTVEKAQFLEKVGFSQIVLARELSIKEIEKICASVNVPVETFVHGALCVSYSGRCHAGELLQQRSANRGRCPQICRLKYDLVDAAGETVVANRHLLSLRDFNASVSLAELMEAGVSSFKIEGRLKDVGYVKNITAHYRRLIDGIITQHPDKYRRSSFGRSELRFTPDPYKSFNRGFTSYFLDSANPRQIASILTPKSLGEPLGRNILPNNGDGLSYFNPSTDTYEGFRVNKVENGRIVPARPIKLPKNVKLYRTFDNEWEKLMARNDTARRTIGVNVELYENRAIAIDERGCKTEVYYEAEMQQARNAFNPRTVFEKTGNTIYRLDSFVSRLPEGAYIPPSILTDLRRKLLESLDAVNKATYVYGYRCPEDNAIPYPSKRLDYRDNVSNHLAREFYMSHGVEEIEEAVELNVDKKKGPVRVMTCRYCILRELGKCLKENGRSLRLPLSLRSSDGKMLPLHFDCKRCEMHVFAGK